MAVRGRGRLLWRSRSRKEGRAMKVLPYGLLHDVEGDGDFPEAAGDGVGGHGVLECLAVAKQQVERCIKPSDHRLAPRFYRPHISDRLSLRVGGRSIQR